MPSSIDLAARLSAVVALQQEVLAASSDFEKVMPIVLGHAAELTGADGAAFEVLEGDELVVTANSGLAPYPAGMSAPLHGTIAADALRKGQVVRTDDFRMESITPGVVIRAAMTAPMLRSGLIMGVLEVYADRSNAFGDLDAYTLQLLSGIASASLMIARSFHDQRVSEERYRMLFERNVAGVFRTTREGRILDCNEALVKVLGYEARDELLGHEAWELYHRREDRESFLDQLKGANALRNLRLQLKRKDGSPIVGIMNVSVIPGDDDDWQLLGTLVADE